jgi:hypothetical protein
MCTLSPLNWSTGEEKEEKPKQISNQVRAFHATRRQEIVAPFIPEMVVFAVVSTGWVIYRKAQGKPLTPDEALEAQEAYRRYEEDLRRRSKVAYGNKQSRKEVSD